ncbi:MBG-2 domain-containing protein, partial [Vibrio parahaemolyticus]|nr:MBG domain-containing protein [Vibrio parahaemolyticus]NMR96722.1 MBG-2 domain-containing protein [Vibrio parahaemolyticus]
KVENPNYEDRTGLATVKITAKEVTITVDSKTKVYGTIDPTFTGTVEGLINGNDLGEITFVRTNDDEEVGTYEGVLDANYTDNPNYKVEVIKGNFEITKAQGEELEVAGYTGVYDGLEHSITVGNLVDGDTVYYSKDGATWTEENPSYTDVGEYKVYVKVENPNYEDRTGLATVTITEKEVTITVDSKTKVYGTIDPEFTGTVEGLING